MYKLLNTKESILLQNYNNIINSYNTLKIILEPNLTIEKKSLMNFFFETLNSQLKLFLDLMTTSNLEKIYELLNNNNQKLSKRISSLFSLIIKNNNNIDSRNAINSKNNFKNLKIESFNRINTNKKYKYFKNNHDSNIINNTGYDKDEDNYNNNNEKLDLNIINNSSIINNKIKKVKLRQLKSNNKEINNHSYSKINNYKYNKKINNKKK